MTEKPILFSAPMTPCERAAKCLDDAHEAFESGRIAIDAYRVIVECSQLPCGNRRCATCYRQTLTLVKP